MAIVDFDSTDVISGSQIVPAVTGQLFEVLTTQGDIPSINRNAIGTVEGDPVIALKNNTSPAVLVNEGLALSGSILAVCRNVIGNGYAKFPISDTYWVDCQPWVKEGSFISSIVPVDPQIVKFPDGVYSMDVTASLDGEAVVLQVTTPELNIRRADPQLTVAELEELLSKL